MTEDWNVHVTVTGKDGSKIKSWRSDEVPEQSFKEVMSENFKEAMNSYRFFGVLRAAVSWLPAVIVLTIISYVSRQFPQRVCSIDLAISILFLVTLFLIYWTQSGLQRRQHRCRALAQVVQNALLGNQHIQNVSSYPYHVLSTKVGEDLKKWDKNKRLLVPKEIGRGLWPDRASWALLGFFVALVLVQFFLLSHLQPKLKLMSFRPDICSCLFGEEPKPTQESSPAVPPSPAAKGQEKTLSATAERVRRLLCGKEHAASPAAGSTSPLPSSGTTLKPGL